ncbi:HARB1 nuclease, partial [Amia calva]|nr:HARB1 nuclease [Amia calva]
SGFPNMIGCLDGTHIPIKAAPGPNEADFVNRKSFHSTLYCTYIISDAQQLITNVEATWPGSVHDSHIFRESTLYQRFQHFIGYLLGDRGYLCLPFLMTPYPNPAPGTQMLFNTAHAMTRARVEMTLGMMNSPFHGLCSLRVTPERAWDITIACVVLHNIAVIRRERDPLLLHWPLMMTPLATSRTT